MIRFRWITGLFALAITGGAAADQGIPIDADWAAKWRADLEFARLKMPDAHIRIDHATPLPELEAALDALAARIPALAHHQAVAELARIVALIGDGHSRLTLPLDPASGLLGGHRPTDAAALPGTPFGQYPVRFYRYADGLAIEQVGAAHSELMGARVRRIGSMSTDETIQAVEPVIHRDNDQQVNQLVPSFLVIPEILHARGVIDSLGPLSLELETAAGEVRRVALPAVAPGEQIDWAVPDPATVSPFRRRLDENYRFEYLESNRTVLFRYVTVRNDDGESLAEFARRMFVFIDTHPVERLVVDIRGNGGGNNWLNAPLERGLMRAEKLWRPGGIAVLADRHTFSAAMNFVSFLAIKTPAVFVGEAAGGRPNHYGDARPLALPNTGLTIRLSTVYHQDSSAADGRAQIDPHVPVPLTAADVRNGRDPVLAEVLGWDGPGAAEGTWQGSATVRHYLTDVALELKHDSGAWTGSFSAAGWIDATAIANAVRAGAEIRFDVPLETTTLRVRARPTVNRLIGMFDYQGQWYAFVAARNPEA